MSPPSLQLDLKSDSNVVDILIGFTNDRMRCEAQFRICVVINSIDQIKSKFATKTP